MKTFTFIKRIVDKFVEILCIILLFIMTVLVTYQVVTRFVFSNPSAISELTAQYLFVWMVMIGSAYMFGLREHLNISLLKDKLPPLLNTLVEILIALLLIIFSFGMTFLGGIRNTLVQMRTTDAALQVPMGVIYSIIPISGAFMIFYAIYNIFLAISNYKKQINKQLDCKVGE